MIATNQPDVGRGILARDLEAILRWLLQQLPIDRVMTRYHGARGMRGSLPLPETTLACCSRQLKRLRIDLANSFMIGDRWRDVECGFNAGCKTIFIDGGYKDTVPNGEPPVYRWMIAA